MFDPRLARLPLSKKPAQSFRAAGKGQSSAAPHNTVTRLKRRRHTPMQEFDSLPTDLRAWLHRAALPWSARSALRLWTDALRQSGGDRAAALARLDRAEARSLRLEARAIWGPGHPSR